MALTLGLTGMDPATEASLKAAFDAVNARLGGVWEMRTDGTADHVIVDMDSMYGPMSWLRLHADRKIVIGLTFELARVLLFVGEGTAHMGIEDPVIISAKAADIETGPGMAWRGLLNHLLHFFTGRDRFRAGRNQNAGGTQSCKD